MAESDYFQFDVKWSSQLEKLADGLLLCWQETVEKAADPFGKVCVVVNDSATENWLKRYFLLDRKIPQVMMNLEFVKLPDFINDWLSAERHGIAPWRRHASAHPYSPGILTWRIYDILSHASADGDFKELVEYIGEDCGQDRKQLRCFALAEKLAVLYDDYLNSRSQMLRNWEKEPTGTDKDDKDVPHWQIRLYQQLAKAVHPTYAEDFETAFAPGLDATRAFEHGFPRYLAVHVFDIPFMPETTLHLLEKISEAFPKRMVFWHFNPYSEWLGESCSKKEMIRMMRETVQKQRDLLHGGAGIVEENTLPVSDAVCDSPEEWLFGALASGARALICNLCNDSNGRVEPVGEREALDELKKQKIFLHKCYSPRRELEAIKDGLLQFFKENEGVRPHEAIVLCADWENYAPIIELVFNSAIDSEGYIPVTVAGGGMGVTPFSQSFLDVLSFRNNRFEADAVFSLLGVPAICRKYQLEESDLGVMRDMIKKANIHWGYDDDDVRRILKIESSDPSSSPYPFTWQRGLDRMTAEYLYGFNEDGYTLLDAGGRIGKLCPCGSVEGDRVKTLAYLWYLVQNLKWVREKFAPEKELSPHVIQENLLEVLRRFYDESEDADLQEANRVRQAIRRTAEDMKVAGMDKSVSVEVFLAAMRSGLCARSGGIRHAGESVQFAPLNCSTAVPHQLVWICGLNDGVFPKINYRASYDLIGKHPSLFDTTSREKDAFALLKAVLGARRQLCFSYVGKDNHTGEDVPPSVLLSDLKDYFSVKGIACTEYEHPMNGYSPEYFTMTPQRPLPPTYSASNYDIAETLQNHEQASGVIPFPLSDDSVTDIRLEDLAEFFSRPHHYLFSKQKIEVPESKYDQICSKECFKAKLDKELQKELILTNGCNSNASFVQVEAGKAPDEKSANAEIEEIKKKYNKENAKDYSDFQKAEKKEVVVDVKIDDGRKVRVKNQYSILCKGDKEEEKRMIFYEDYTGYESTKNKILLQYLGANAAEGNVSVMVISNDKPLEFSEISIDDAKKKLSEILKMSGKPLPPDFRDFRRTDKKYDKLPPDWQKLLTEYCNDCIEAKKDNKKTKSKADKKG